MSQQPDTQSLTPSKRQAAAIQVKPAGLANHVLSEHDIVVGVTPGEFIQKLSSVQFDYAEFQKNISKVGTDYNLMFNKSDKINCVAFASKILYSVAPNSRKVKGNEGDKYWTFAFPGSDNTHKYAYVATKAAGIEYTEAANDKVTSKTMTQASVLSLATIERICYLYPDKRVLTPLARSVFSKGNTEALARHRSCDVVKANKVINASCQCGGHYLDSSDGSVAIVATYYPTRHMPENKLRNQFVAKTFKQYDTMRKAPTIEYCKIVAQYATGAVPREFLSRNMDTIFAELEQLRVSPLAAVRESSRTMAPTTYSFHGYDTPNPLAASVYKQQAKVSSIPANILFRRGFTEVGVDNTATKDSIV